VVDLVEMKLGWPHFGVDRLFLAPFALVELWAGYQLCGVELTIPGCFVLNCGELIDYHLGVPFDIAETALEKLYGCLTAFPRVLAWAGVICLQGVLSSSWEAGWLVTSTTTPGKLSFRPCLVGYFGYSACLQIMHQAPLVVAALELGVRFAGAVVLLWERRKT
jgi:hypothetical protein